MTVYEQNVERATRAELWEPGEEVIMTWSPDHTFAVQAGGEPRRRSQRAGRAGRRGRRRSRGGRSTPPGHRAAKFLVGGVVASAAVGFGAFLAGTAGGAKASALAIRGRR